MLEICEKIFTAFEEQEIRYCHWKSNEHLLPGLVGDTDLDILVDSDVKAKCLMIYKDLKVLSLNAQFGSRYPNVEDYIAFDASTGKLIHIHQHYKIVTGHTGLKEYILPYEKVVLATRIKHPETGIYVASPEAELYILYLRIVLKSSVAIYKHARNGDYLISEDVKREIEYLKGICTKESCLSFYQQYGMDTSLVSYIWTEELTADVFVKLYEYVTSHFGKYSRLPPLKRSVMMRLYPWMIRVNRALRKRLQWNTLVKKSIPNGGLAVAFIGQDGSGKSTITKDIEKWFLWKVDAQRFYLGSGDYYSPWQKKLLKRISVSKKKLSLLSYLSGILSVSLCCSASKHALTQLKKAKKYKIKGGVALFDRFPQRQFEGIFDGPKIRELFLNKTSNRIFRRIIERFAAKEEKYLDETQNYLPDIVFKLILSVDESMKRKPENNREDIERKNYIAERLDFPGARVVSIDAEDSYAAEFLKIKNYIWDILFERK